MKNILITGASGFLGGHIFSQADTKYNCLGAYNNYSPSHSIPNWAHINLTDFSAVLKMLSAFMPAVVIHSAANSSLDECEKNPQSAHAANVLATSHLVRAAKQIGARFIFVSTDMVFDGTGSRYTENDATHPLSVYGQTKVQAEKVVQELDNHLIVRSALIYGRRQFGGSSFSMWMENRLQHKQPLPLYVDQFRSPILVNNLADMLIELCDSEFTGILHAGGANRIDRFSFGQQMCRILRYDPSLLQPIKMADHAPFAPRPRDVSLNIDKAISILKTELLSTADGLQRLK